jgi:hypothetical protein
MAAVAAIDADMRRMARASGASRHVSPLVKAFIELAASDWPPQDDKVAAVFNQSFG